MSHCPIVYCAFVVSRDLPGYVWAEKLSVIRADQTSILAPVRLNHPTSRMISVHLLKGPVLGLHRSHLGRLPPLLAVVYGICKRCVGHPGRGLLWRSSLVARYHVRFCKPAVILSNGIDLIVHLEVLGGVCGERLYILTRWRGRGLFQPRVELPRLDQALSLFHVRMLKEFQLTGGEGAGVKSMPS